MQTKNPPSILGLERFRVSRRWLAVTFVLLALGAGPRPAAAAVWGYVDDKGIVHLAAEKLDDRYELFFKPGGSPAAGADDARLDLQRDVALPRGRQKLLTYFDLSPEFKAIRPLLREVSDKHQIDIELLQALIAVESGYNARAVSPKGALGLMQIMPDTAARYGVTGDAKRSVQDKLFEPRTNLNTGTRYLVDLKRMFPNRLDLALASYNAGEGAVQKYGNKIPPYKETQAYVQTVIELYRALKPPKQAYVPSTARLQMPLVNAARRSVPDITAAPGGRLQMRLPAPPAVAAMPDITRD